MVSSFLYRRFQFHDFAAQKNIRSGSTYRVDSPSIWIDRPVAS
jgi:hypothetical protein